MTSGILKVEVTDERNELLLRYHVRRDGTVVTDREQYAPAREERRAVMRALEAALITTGPTSVSIAPERE